MDKIFSCEITEDHIGKNVNILSKKLKYACNSYLIGRGENLTGEQCKLLGYISSRIDRGELVFQRDVEKEFDIKRSSAANILSNLEKNGYIQRMVDKNDSRTKIIHLTEKGKNLDKEMMNNIDRLEAVISEDMTEEERLMFIDLLKRAIRNVDSSGMLKK